MRHRQFNKVLRNMRMWSGWLQPTLKHLGIDEWGVKQRKAYTVLQQDTRRSAWQDEKYVKLRVQARKFRKLRRRAAKKLGVTSRLCPMTISRIYVYLASLKKIWYS